MKTVNDYMKLPYHLVIQERNSEDGNYFFGRIMELDGCMSDGRTVEELRNNIREAMELWLEVSLEKGDAIPEPQTESAYSGRFNLRIPRSLHERLAYEAKEEGVSLNQYALYKLAR
jgi:antitoxin HicB